MSLSYPILLTSFSIHNYHYDELGVYISYFCFCTVTAKASIYRLGTILFAYIQSLYNCATYKSFIYVNYPSACFGEQCLR